MLAQPNAYDQFNYSSHVQQKMIFFFFFTFEIEFLKIHFHLYIISLILHEI